MILKRTVPHPHAYIVDLQQSFDRIRQKSQYFAETLQEANQRLNWITNYAAVRMREIERYLESETRRKDS